MEFGMPDKTAIVLINYNNHDDTIKCVESISNAGFGNSIVIVDNKSTAPGVDDIQILYPNVVLIKNDENIGFGRANNVGIQWILKNSNCEYIFILNNDTIIEKSTISKLQEALFTHTEAAMATPRIVVAGTTNKLWYGGGDMDWKKGVPKTPGYLGPVDTPLALKKRYVTFASGCAMFFRRSAIEKLRGFDSRFFMYCEDMELCLRVLKLGWKIIYEPNSIIKHRVQGTQRNNDEKLFPILHPLNPKLEFYVYHMTKNRLLTINMHGQFKNKLMFLSYFPLYMIWKCLQFLSYKKIGAVLLTGRSILDYFKER
jgi:GT2 family glycosyltransferase